MTQPVNMEALISLQARYQKFKHNNPQQRIRNIAEALQVSEVELLALRCGDAEGSVQRLKNHKGCFQALMREIRELGDVMALTRNDSVVHEKTASYGKLAGGESVGLFLGDIDLRLFFDQWQYGYHVSEDGRRSLQFFDAAGVAIHKIYANDATDMARFDTLVTHYLAEDQQPGQYVVKSAEISEHRLTKPKVADDAVDLKGFHQDWDQLKDVHDFFSLLKTHQLERQQAFRLAGVERAVPLATEVFEQALQKVATEMLPVMIFVGNAGGVQIHTGPVKKLMRRGPWFNVLDSGFNLHANTEVFTHAWLVRRPTEDGIISSLEVFDKNGVLALQMFGARKPGQIELIDWQNIIKELEKEYSL